eukprot:12420957-Karenia_brevis.AAC.2
MKQLNTVGVPFPIQLSAYVPWSPEHINAGNPLTSSLQELSIQSSSEGGRVVHVYSYASDGGPDQMKFKRVMSAALVRSPWILCDPAPVKWTDSGWKLLSIERP